MARWMVLGVAFGLFTQSAFAHKDDPKGLNPDPPYTGMGWSAGSDATAATLNKSQAAAALPGAQVAGGTTFPALNVELLSWLSLSQLGAGSSAASCWGYTSPSGREYAVVAMRSGTGFVEVTDPENATLVGSVSGPTSLWRDSRVYDQFAYSVSEGGQGIQVIDLRNIDNGSVSLLRTVNDVGTGRTHTVFIDTDSGYLYRAGGPDRGLRIYSLANPQNPQFVSQWDDRYVHEVTVVTYTEGPYAGRQIAFACGGFNGGWDQTGLDILDVTDKQNIVQLRRVQYPSAGYSHQIWLSADRRYAYLNDELDESDFNVPTRTLIFNVEDLSQAQYVGSFTNNDVAVGHNLYVKGNYIYEANYVSGLRVFDASNPLAPVEIAWFDTAPNRNDQSFNGAWCTYPFFESGTVLISDMQAGLFVVRVNLPLLAGDLNCDGAISVSDIAAFVMALTDPAGYASAFANCDINAADLNGDNMVTVSDIAGFVALLTGA